MMARKAPHTAAPPRNERPKERVATFSAWLLALLVCGCAGRVSVASPNGPTQNVPSPNASLKAKSARNDESATRAVRRPSGLPSSLAPLDHMQVVNFAFANDSAYAAPSDAHVAGAIEDAQGLTVCLLSGALSIPDGSMIPHPVPFATSSRVHCFREDGVSIARASRPAVGRFDHGIGFALGVVTPSGTKHRIYSFDETAVHESDAPDRPIKIVQERVGRPPPWSRSIAQDYRASRIRDKGLAKLRAPVGVKIPAQPLNQPPAWVSILERNSELETRQVGGGEEPKLALTLSRGSLVDREPARQVLTIRAGDRWLCSDTLPEVISEVADAPTLGPGAVLALTRTQSPSTGPKARFPYADEAMLHVLVADAVGLREAGKLQVGELGHSHYLGKNRVWRVFYQARAVAPGCLEVRRDHAITGVFDRRLGKLTASTRVRKGIPGLPDEVPARYARTEGRYIWDGRALTRGLCR